MFETQFNHPLNKNFEEQINSFFTELGLPPVKVELTILENQEYDKSVDTQSTVTLHSMGAKEAKATTLIEEIGGIGYRIYVRQFNNAVDLTAIIGSFLQVHYPNADRETVEKAVSTFESAYKCYDQLFRQKPLRDFFILLCKEDKSLFSITNLQLI